MKIIHWLRYKIYGYSWRWITEEEFWECDTTEHVDPLKRGMNPFWYSLCNTNKNFVTQKTWKLKEELKTMTRKNCIISRKIKMKIYFKP